MAYMHPKDSQISMPRVMREWAVLGLRRHTRQPGQYEIRWPEPSGSGAYDQIKSTSTTASAVLYVVPTLSVVDQVRQIEESLGLNRSQTAAALQVTRKTVYDWLDKGANLSDSNTEDRLRKLAEIARAQTEDIGKYIGMNLQRPIVGKLSLLKVLVADDIDVGLAKSMLDHLVPMAMASKARVEAIAQKRPPALQDRDAQATIEHFASRS